ncbi:hypothetical protein SAMN04487894_105142 [Niabella drilacis]|uniref:Uncharacterized protein n=1 Tax=Niabella drilacis (strain DSM 25811 / CCM 8410 / CCUG 62505 / LMG 26954 / E90) TaxID=1285928 RepID=A0A1G6R4E1_NIADE|nr:hypothetical protein SAMN04487894_105142 [Niabella drilacis]
MEQRVYSNVSLFGLGSVWRPVFMRHPPGGNGTRILIYGFCLNSQAISPPVFTWNNTGINLSFKARPRSFGIEVQENIKYNNG